MAHTEKPKVIVILGMHRSGTSALTRALSVIQTTLSSDTITTTNNNPKGYWEDKVVVGINERLISALESRWCDLFTIEPSAIVHFTEGEIFNQAVQLVRSKLSAAAAWGVKDPRMCRLLPFWIKVFEHVGCEATYIHAIRNPINVAASLYARDALALSHSYLLWAEHVVWSVRETTKSQRVTVVDYDLLLTNPAAELGRVAKACRLPPPDLKSSEYKEYSEEFLDSNLRHNVADVETLQSHPHVPAFVKTLYIELLKAASDIQDLSCKNIFQAVSIANKELSAPVSTVKALNSLVHDNRFGLREVSRLNQEVARLKTCLENFRLHETEQKAVIKKQDEMVRKILASKSWWIATKLQAIPRYAKVFRWRGNAHE